MDIIDYPTKRVLPQRTAGVKAIILHTTGETDLDKILKFYNADWGYQPHYFIEVTGAVRRCVAENLIAYHCAIKPLEQTAYKRGWAYWSMQEWKDDNTAQPYGRFFPGYTGWNNKWRSRGLESPLDLVTGNMPNSVSLGIEMQQPTDALLTPDIFTDEQYASLNELLQDRMSFYRIPVDDGHLLGHYDVSPMRRTNAKTPNGWDPGGKFNWDRVFTALR